MEAVTVKDLESAACLKQSGPDHEFVNATREANHRQMVECYICKVESSTDFVSCGSRGSKRDP